MATTASSPAPASSDDEEGICDVRRWYVHLAASAVAFAGGLTLLLAWRAVSVLRRRLRRRAVGAATTAPPSGRIGCGAALRELAGRLVSSHTTTGRATLLLNFILSMASVGFYVYEAASWTGRVEHCFPWSRSPLMIVDLAFNCLYLARFCLRFLAAKNKLWFWLELHSIVDYCTVPPAFVGLYLHQYWLGLRFLRAAYIMSLPDVLQKAGLLNSGSVIRLLQLVTIFACVWFLGASAIHVLENSVDPSTYGGASGATFGDCLYFTIVTMSTVGFGDITPQSSWGRTFTSLYIPVALSIFASYMPEIAGMVQGRSRYAGAYKPEHGRKHIVVCGAISRQSVDTFLTNLLHADRKACNSLEVVCLSPMKPDLEFQGLLRKYFRNLTYLEGTILSTTDCRRACLSSAAAAIVLASQYSHDPDELDAENTMRAVSIKNAAPSVRCIVQLLQCRSKPQLESIPNWDCRLGDECICSEELRLGLLAQSCAAPGFSTLMANLFATRSVPKAPGSAWEHDYHVGSAKEIYAEVFGPAFGGMTFAEAAAVCFSELGITLVAAMTEADDPESQLLLVNPSSQVEGFRIPARQQCRGFFLADSQEEVQQIVRLQAARAARAGSSHRAADATDGAQPPAPIAPRLLNWCSKARDLEGEALLPIATRKSGDRPVQLSGHYILCVIGGGASSPSSASNIIGLRSFVAPLRSEAHARRDLRPIVIVGELSHLRQDWTELCHFPEVYVVPGSPMSRACLRAAGIDRCDMCVVISGHCWRVADDAADLYLMDREVIMCTLNIKAMDQPGSSDLYYRALGLQTPETAPHQRLGTPTLTEIFVDKNIQYLEQDDDDSVVFEEVHSTEAFASGCAFTASVLDSLLATVYYNASAMRLIRGLAASRVTQLSMADHRLATATCDCSTFGRLFLKLLRQHGILCFGVNRYRDSYGGPGTTGRLRGCGALNKRIVIACPRADFRLLGSDTIFCLMPASNFAPVGERVRSDALKS